MKKILEEVIKFFSHPKFKTFAWTTLNGLIVVTATQLSEIEWIYAPLLIALLNGVTKFINRDILGRV